MPRRDDRRRGGRLCGPLDQRPRSACQRRDHL